MFEQPKAKLIARTTKVHRSWLKSSWAKSTPSRIVSAYIGRRHQSCCSRRAASQSGATAAAAAEV